MKIQVPDQQIAQIAEELDSESKCFYNFQTKEITTVIDSNDPWDFSDEDNLALAEIEENRDNYFEIKKMDSRSSFLVMEEFIDGIPDAGLRNRLINSLSRPKPFRNFKIEIDINGDFRQRWFDFKKKKMIEWVKAQIEDFNSHNIEG